MPDLPNPIVWSTSSKGLTLPEDEIHIWRAGLDRPPDVLSNLETNLVEEERSATRFHFLLAIEIISSLAAAFCGNYSERIWVSHPPRLSFVMETERKPSTDGRCSISIRFNISPLTVLLHSPGAAKRPRVGIDLEQIRPEFAAEEIAERHFRTGTRGLRALPPALVAEFSLCWTRKEAYVKARGAGLQIHWTSFNVPHAGAAGDAPERGCSAMETSFLPTCYEPFADVRRRTGIGSRGTGSGQPQNR